MGMQINQLINYLIYSLCGGDQQAACSQIKR